MMASLCPHSYASECNNWSNSKLVPYPSCTSLSQRYEAQSLCFAHIEVSNWKGQFLADESTVHKIYVMNQNCVRCIIYN